MLRRQKHVLSKIKTYTGTSPPHFSKKAMPWGKKMAGTNEFSRQMTVEMHDRGQTHLVGTI